MTQVVLRATPGPGAPSRPELARALLSGPASGWLVPALRLDDGASPARWPAGEDLGAVVTYGGPSLAPAVLEAAASEAAEVHFAVGLSMALPTARGLTRGVHLLGRVFGADAPPRPLCRLELGDRQLQLRFEVAGRPLFAPPGAPAGWREAVEYARTCLADAVAALGAAGAELELSGDVGPWPLKRLGEHLMAPRLEVAPPSVFLATTAPTPGPCLDCRHANQGTIDLTMDGLLACRFAGSRFGLQDPQCDVELEVGTARRFAFERYDGANCTWADRLPIQVAEQD